jgi:hypothetical protein
MAIIILNISGGKHLIVIGLTTAFAGYEAIEEVRDIADEGRMASIMWRKAIS